MGQLVRRVLDGDTVVAEWTTDDPSTVEKARSTFNEELEAGYNAVRDDDGDKTPVTELPPDADVVILTMPMGGG
jgi:hypothetical protein